MKDSISSFTGGDPYKGIEAGGKLNNTAPPAGVQK